MKQTRIDLTEREWIEVRILALDAGLTLPAYLARLVREALGMKEDK
jgi:hypothetical protein